MKFAERCDIAYAIAKAVGGGGSITTVFVSSAAFLLRSRTSRKTRSSLNRSVPS